MDAVAALARTATNLAATGCRSSAPVRPAASLSLAASSRPRGRVGLSTAGRGRATRDARVVPRRSVVASSEVEQTYIMIKPDGVQRGLVGEIISRFEKKGFFVEGLKAFSVPQGLGSGGMEYMADESVVGGIELMADESVGCALMLTQEPRKKC